MTKEEHNILASLMRQIQDELQKNYDKQQDVIIMG